MVRIRRTRRDILIATTSSTPRGTGSRVTESRSAPGCESASSNAAPRRPTMPDPSTLTPTGEEIMTVAAARAIRDGVVCFVGIGVPSAAANLALRTHAPHAVLVYESGVIGARPSVLPLSIGDGELVEGALAVVGVPEMFAYWLQGGRIDVGFLGAAQRSEEHTSELPS